MPIVPQTGQLAISNLRSTANDSIIRNITTDASLKNLRDIIVADGQPSPELVATGNDDINMGAFRGSQIMGIQIITYQETPTTYGTKNDGIIDVTIALTKFSTNSSVTIRVYIGNVNIATEIIYTNGSIDSEDITGLNANTYKVTVTDNGTGRSFTFDDVVVTYNKGSNTYKKNYA